MKSRSREGAGSLPLALGVERGSIATVYVQLMRKVGTSIGTMSDYAVAVLGSRGMVVVGQDLSQSLPTEQQHYCL